MLQWSNPVFILPSAIDERAIEIANGLAGSITQGVGQFCTNPGLCFVAESSKANEFYTQLITKISEVPAGVMLTPDIKNAYENGIQKTKTIHNVNRISSGLTSDNSNTVHSNIFRTTIQNYFQNASLAEENFGPSSVLVDIDTKDQILNAAKNLKGHLTATVIGSAQDFESYKELFDILELKVGRVLINGYPTGVEVCHSMVHGGPYPATTAPQSTSVGTNAIKRFVRPVCFQDFPDTLLPLALQSNNPLKIWRLVNGVLEK